MTCRRILASLLLAGAATLAIAPAAEVPLTPATATAPAPVGPAPRTGRRGIVLMTVDSLRVDHVGCYGPGRPTGTPAIDLLAATGVRFERAYAASVSSVPSVASILTGLVPSGHGLRDDLGGHLGDGVRTIADRLRAAGWATAAAIGTEHLDSSHGLASGFDRYDDDIKGVRKERLFFAKERRASEVADAALAAFEAMPPEKPFFLWLDFRDPHYDYDPEEPHKSAWPASPYDGEVAAVDASIGSVTRTLRDRIPGGRLLFVVAGTHGEGLGDRKEMGHGVYLNDATTRVPLVMTWGRPRGGGGIVVPAPVSLLDVAPTLLEVAEVEPARKLPGISQAAILAPGAGPAGTAADRGRKEKRAAPRRIYVEAMAPWTAYGWSPLFSVTEGTRRVVQGERLEAFDLEADPGASAPLASEPRWARDLVAHGRALLGPLGVPAERRRDIDAAVTTLDPPWEGSPFCGERDTRPDPRDPLRVELQEPLFLAGYETELKIVGRAWKRGGEILEKDPANPTALETFIILGLRNHWPDQQVLDPLEILTCQYPYRPQGYHYLGHFYTTKRNWEQALKAFTLMRMADPGDQEADYDLACTYAAMGKKDEALEHLKRSLDRGSDDYAQIRRDGRLAPLRDDPRFQALAPAPPSPK